MSPIKDCIVNKNTKIKPIWLMRQAGRYLPEFREIRKINQNFIKLCLNENLASEITLQPLRRFDFDAAIIFSDILMLPYGLGQEIKFKKDFGPLLGNFNLENAFKISEKDFSQKLFPIYQILKNIKKNKLLKNKDLIGFVGAPWTLLVYILNKQSPKKRLDQTLFENKSIINNILNIIVKFLKLHIKNQINNGATLIQIFDSWAGLVNEKDLFEYVYKPTLSLVEYTKSLNVPAICFPRNIKNYKEYVNEVKPNAINIDYNIDINRIKDEIDITIQGGMNPQFLLEDKEILKKETLKFLNLFKDHPYIFNLGHGVLPETNPENVDYLVKLVKDF